MIYEIKGKQTVADYKYGRSYRFSAYPSSAVLIRSGSYRIGFRPNIDLASVQGRNTPIQNGDEIRV